MGSTFIAKAGGNRCSEHAVLRSNLPSCRPPTVSPQCAPFPCGPFKLAYKRSIPFTPECHARPNGNYTKQKAYGRSFERELRNTTVLSLESFTFLDQHFCQKHAFQPRPSKRNKLHRRSLVVSAAKTTSFVKWTSAQSTELRALEQWLQKAALPSQKVVIEEVGEGQGRGLVAVQGIWKGDTVLKVPQSLSITADKAYNVPVLGPLLKDAKVPDWPALAIFLLYERSRGPSSEWAAYIAALPRQTGCVLEWPEGQVENFLWGSPLQEKARLCIRDVEESFEDLNSVLFSKHPRTFPGKVFTLNNFKWAFSILFSRLVRLAALDNAVCLVPFADMANHSVDAATFFEYDSQAEAVVLKADRGYEKGQQVFVSYGPRSSGDLLLSYGFVPKLETNPHESLDLPFELPPSSSGNPPPREYDFQGQRYPIRLTGMPEQLWEAARRKALEVPGGGENQEIAARQLLLDACRKVLRSYKKSMEEDEALAEERTSDESLNAVSFTQREIAAATVRVIERRILYRTEAVLRSEIRALKQQEGKGGGKRRAPTESQQENPTILSRLTNLFR